jgi:hypothetical protein
MQRSKISLAIATLGIVGTAMSHQASAGTVATAGGGNGDLILAVTDTTTGATFYQDLSNTPALTGTTPGALSTMTPTTAKSFSINDALDTNYTSLVTEAGGTSGLEFAVIAGANGPSSFAGANVNSYLTSSGTAKYTSTTITNTNLGNFNLIDQNVVNPLNSSGTESANNSFYFSSTSGGPLYSSASGLWKWNGKTSINTIAPVGTALSNLYYLTGSGSSGHAAATLLGTAEFNAGVFTFTAAGGGSAVPLPAAIWLLGSGLAGLVGIGRRRSLAA